MNLKNIINYLIKKKWCILNIILFLLILITIYKIFKCNNKPSSNIQNLIDPEEYNYNAEEYNYNDEEYNYNFDKNKPILGQDTNTYTPILDKPKTVGTFDDPNPKHPYNHPKLKKFTKHENKNKKLINNNIYKNKLVYLA